MKIAMAMENLSRYGGGAESYAVGLAQTLRFRGLGGPSVRSFLGWSTGRSRFSLDYEAPALGPAVHKDTGLCSSPQENDSGRRIRCCVGLRKHLGNERVPVARRSSFLKQYQEASGHTEPLGTVAEVRCPACDTEVPRKSVDRIRAFPKKPTTCHHSYFGYGQERHGRLFSNK